MICIDPEYNYHILLNKLSLGVQECLILNKGKPHENQNGTFKSKNMIPREVRSLFKSKAKASKILRKYTSATRILNARRKS